MSYKDISKHLDVNEKHVSKVLSQGKNGGIFINNSDWKWSLNDP